MPLVESLRRVILAGLTALSLTVAPRATAQTLPTSPSDTVRGVVFDSLANEPLAEAFIVASPGNATATSDSLGRFSLASNEPVQQLTVYHSALDDMGLSAIGATRPANVRAWSNASVATPSLNTLWPRLCDSRRPVRQRTGIIIGTARLADNTTRVAGAKVIVQWSPVLPSRDQLHVLETVTDSLGNFIVCGVEEFAEPSLGAISAEARSGAIALPSDMRPLRRVDLMLAAPGDAGATLRGRVLSEQGAGLGGVRVDVDGVDSTAVTADDGGFVLRDVPLGSRMLSLRAVGYSPVAQVVEVVPVQSSPLTLRLARAVELEGVRITERADVRAVRREFDERRRTGFARYIDSTEFERVANLRTALSMVQSGISLQPLRRNSTEFVITGANGCPAHTYIDGVIATAEDVNVIPPRNIAAVEIYRNVALAPAKYVRVAADACVVVLFWTKAGLRP